MEEIFLVSVIIPTYNRADDLKRAITSVINQTYSNWEIIIVDNNSTDSTDSVVLSFNKPSIKMFKINNNGIIAASRNMGIEKSSGNIIAFLDSDDWWAKDKLSLCVKYLLNGYDFVFHNMIVIKKNKDKISKKRSSFRKLKIPFFKDFLSKGNCIFNSSVVVKKEIIGNEEWFDENPGLITIEDFDLWLRIAKKTNKFKQLRKYLGWYWCGSGNTTSAEKTFNALQFFINKYKSDIESLSLEKTIQWFYYAKGIAAYRLGKDTESLNALYKISFLKAPFDIILKTCYVISHIFLTNLVYKWKK